MLAWLITVGEGLPIDSGSPRLWRTSLLASKLLNRNHQVIRWTSAFDHSHKTFRSDGDQDIQVDPNYKIKLIKSIGYKKNVSLKRLVDHYVLGWKFSKAALSEERPDIIVCSLPTIELAHAATEYGKKMNVPVILDLRDMWPDIFLEMIPNWGSVIGKVALQPMYRKLKAACRNATAIFGITEAFLEWGLKNAGRTRNGFDAVFHHAYNLVQPSDSEISRAESFWRSYDVSKDDPIFTACFFGYFGRQFEIQTVLDAARKLRDLDANIRFVLCGDGDSFEHYKAMAADLDNVVLPGFVGQPEIWTLMRMSRVGLAPYHSTSSFIASLPNKVGEYLSAGLPIVSSLKGELENLLSVDQCGITYPNMDKDKLSDILLELSRNKQLSGNMAIKSRTISPEKFGADKVYGDMAHQLERIVKDLKNFQQTENAIWA